jgi:hypothetical protein
MAYEFGPIEEETTPHSVLRGETICPKGKGRKGSNFSIWWLCEKDHFPRLGGKWGMVWSDVVG